MVRTLLLADTAGLRQTDDPIEAEGIRRSNKKLEEANLILAVFDLSRPLSQEDLALAQRCRGRLAIAIFNKSDLPQQAQTEQIADCFCSYVADQRAGGGVQRCAAPGNPRSDRGEKAGSGCRAARERTAARRGAAGLGRP